MYPTSLMVLLPLLARIINVDHHRPMLMDSMSDELGLGSDVMAMLVFGLISALSRNRERQLRREDLRRSFLWQHVQEHQLMQAYLGQVHVTLDGLPIRRRWWVKPGSRSTDWWENVVLRYWDEDDWLSNFRMNKETFNYVVEMLRPNVERQVTKLRSPFKVEHRLALTLYGLATGNSFRCISNQFGVAKSTAVGIYHDVCRAIEEVLMPKFITVPEGQELLNNVEKFRLKGGFPQIAAAIDGTHIKIKAPQDDPQDYFNHKSSYSIVVQALVDANGRFIDTFVGMPGSVHDARVFAISSLSDRLKNNELFNPNPVEVVEGCNIPLLIIGDLAYPLLPNLMRPFSGRGRLTHNQNQFNYKLSSARMVVEHAFGRLKGRWRLLLKENEHELGNLRHVVQACCTLHNICISNCVPYRSCWDEGVEIIQNEEACRLVPTGEAENVRQSIMTYLGTI